MSANFPQRRSGFDLHADAKVPVMVALRTGEAIWLASADEYRDRFADAVTLFGSLSDTQAQVALRLIHQDDVVGATGAMSLSFPAPSAFGATDHAFTLLLAQATAAALHRALAYDAERERRRDVEVLAKAREDVLGVVAHDLRNPLNLISTTTQFLLEDDLDRPRRSAMLERCLRSVRQMNRLIADLLDTVRLQAGRLSLNLEDVPIADVNQQCADTFRPLADAQQIAFRVEDTGQGIAPEAGGSGIRRFLAGAQRRRPWQSGSGWRSRRRSSRHRAARSPWRACLAKERHSRSRYPRRVRRP